MDICDRKLIKEKIVSKEGLDKIRELASNGISFKDIAEQFSISNWALWKYRKENPDIDKAYLDGVEMSVGIVENALFKNATMPTPKFPYGNVTAQIFFLCNRAPDRWRSSIKGDIAITDSRATAPFGDLSDSQLKALADGIIAKEGGADATGADVADAEGSDAGKA